MTRQRSWWGWGYDDAHLDRDGLDGLAGELARRFDVEVAPAEPARAEDVDVPPPTIAAPQALEDIVTDDPVERLRHGHGQAFRDVVRAFAGDVPRVPDLVAYPRTPEGVAAVLGWCSDAGVACVPFGGGTSVVGGVTPPDGDQPVVTLDLARLDRVVEVDATSLAARVQGGALGPSIDEQLHAHRLTLRHFPQSWEFSTLGGWIATRAGGHFATGPTRIDDLVESITAITPQGEWSSRRLPASGAGPSPDRLLLGSEGTLGVITEAWVRVQRRPTFRASATVTFPDFMAGGAAIRALAQSGLQPANCRLLDAGEALLAGAGDGSRAVLVLGFESADHPLGTWIDRGVELCRDHGGTVSSGPTLKEGDRTGQAEGGAAAWRELFLQAPYLRDGLIALGAVVETFETAVTWDRFESTVERVKATAEAAVRDVCGAGTVTMRTTHAYTDGVAPYLTVVAPGRGRDRVRQWDAVKAAVSEVLIGAGATITHHHAVGRDHVPWYQQQCPELFGTALAAAKGTLDPAGVLNPGVLGLGGMRT